MDALYLPASDSIRRTEFSRWQGDRYLQILAGAVLGAPLWWVLGLNLFVYHIAALLAFMALVLETSYHNRKLAVPPAAWYLVAIAAIYGFSILLNAGSYEVMRIIAAANNLSYWLMGSMLVVVLSSRFRLRHLPAFLRLFAMLGVSNLLIIGLALWIMSRGVDSLSLPTPLSGLTQLLGQTALVEYSVQIRIITEDYFSQTATPRFNLYGPYPTAAGAFFMISLPMLVTWAAVNKKFLSVSFGLLFLGHVMGFAMTLSRTAVVALMASTALVFVAQKRRPWAWCLPGLIALVLAAPWLQRCASAVIAAREGSSLSRFALYRDSILRLEDLDWVVGRGMRTFSDKHTMPFGSHSTYVSLLFRTGLVGLSIFVCLQVWLLLRWYRTKKYVRANRQHFLVWCAFGVVFLSMALWMLTEDIDVPQLLAFMYFGSIGVFEGFRRALVAPDWASAA